ncbi:metallo-sulfur cluster assembly [Aureococcus anophagefferens]|nr:metallo-sulfur cluster assembly [Aureococcus anophagefferens]
MAALARPLVAPAPAVSGVVAVPPGPADAARVASWKLMLADGAAVELTFASPGDLEASRLALLVGGFTLGAAAAGRPPADGLAPPEVSATGCSALAPCANCSCGRREALDAENASKAAAGAPPPATSACGNCGKGDAFRCAGCPHLGKPAFKENEPAGKLVLDLTDDFDL